MDVEHGLRERIRAVAEQRLARPLTNAEWANVCKPRSLTGLEAIGKRLCCTKLSPANVRNKQ